MTPMQSFIEKAKNDKELMAKLDALGVAGAEADKFIALAAEHGFSITAEEYQLACESAGASKSGELAEQELGSVAGGGLAPTQNRWNPEVCNNYTRTHYDCVGLLALTWCDHYKTVYIDKEASQAGLVRHVCNMGRFNYVGDKNGNVN